MRVLRGLAALVVLGLLLVGAPWLLLTVGALPQLTATSAGALPAELWAVLTGPDDGSFLLVALTLVGWVAWLVLLLSLLAEVVSLARGRRFRLPGLGVPQQLLRPLLLAVLALAVVPSAVAEATPTGTVATAPVHTERQQLPAAPAEQDADPDQVVHEVVLGDDLWSLAEQYYGDGSRWRQIAEANPDRLTGGADHLVPGWRLVLPGVPTPAVEVTAAGTVTVVAGDTLSGLAETHLGGAEHWPELLAANADVLADPDELPVGAVLALPQTAETEREQAVSDARAEDEADRARAEQAREDHQQRQQQRPPTPAPEPQQQPTTQQQHPTERPEPTERAEPTEPTEQRADQAASAERDELARIGVIGSTGGLLAAALVGGIAQRRTVQLATRAPGRQLPVPSAPAQLVRSALDQHQQPLGAEQLAGVQRRIARHCVALGVPIPPLDHVLVAPEQISVTHGAPEIPPPPGFTARPGAHGTTWTITPAAYRETQPASDHPASDHPATEDAAADGPVAWPALVSLGRTEEGALLVCLQRLGLTAVQGPAVAVEAAMSALMMELGCSGWSSQLATTVVGPAGVQFAAAAELTTLDAVPDLEPALARLERRWAAQQAEQSDPRVRRLDPGADTAWAPTVLLLGVLPEPDQWRRLQRLHTAGAPLAVVVPGPAAAAGGVLTLSGDDERATATLRRPGCAPLTLAPQLVGAEVRAAVLELMRVSGSTGTTPAPWWPSAPPAAPPVDPPTLARLPFTPWKEADAVTGPPAGTPSPGVEPTVLLLGVVELVGARGPAPSRAVKQCVEYCAWLLEHPGRTAPAMAAALVVAEGTRRSNMSRLRRWLGEDEEDQPYLPDAYSGRISLHPGVGSDLDELRTLVAGGVPAASTERLLTALRLVRGAPLADAAPGQWGWAEELRIEILCTLRDVALVVTDRALAAGDLDMARWAAARGLTVSPDDERLLAARVRTEHRAGNQAEVERLARRLTRQARLLEVDLDPETVDLLQQVMEGRIRSREA